MNMMSTTFADVRALVWLSLAFLNFGAEAAIHLTSNDNRRCTFASFMAQFKEKDERVPRLDDFADVEE